MNEDQREAAEYAVKKVFAIFGVNVDEPHEVEEFRENLRFAATMRRAASRGALMVIGLVAAGIVATLWTGFLTAIRGGH